MRIALITRRFPPLIGGAEKVFSYLAAALAAEGSREAVKMQTGSLAAYAFVMLIGVVVLVGVFMFFR